jgi:small subunit ribosomal protein S25e
MGGKKKLGLKQMERQQVKEDDEKSKEKKKEKAGTPKEKRTIIGVVAPDVKNERNVAEIEKMNVLTPYAVAAKFGIRISAAKDFLEQLEKNGIVQLVSGSHSIKVYKPVAA